jgi:Werner syndrome ATP-dependent helicase
MDIYEESKCKTVRHKKVKTLLKEKFGYGSFKPKQYEIINNIINGTDVVAVLPTGYGKSLTYQIPALYLEKVAIVISPLISLMEDQKAGLDEKGITSCCFNSNVVNKIQMKNDILKGTYQFIYIAPEMAIKMGDFFKELNEAVGISLIAIDEAHCISAYGFDFRSSYRGLSEFKSILPDVPILAVTATATDVVIADIIKVLKITDCELIKSSFDRPNLFLNVAKKSKSPADDLVPLIKKHKGQCIIIYCLTRKETELIAEIINKTGIEARYYHADMAPSARSEVHNKFLSGELQCIVATIAFGMGINKANVRAVIHYGSPKNIESYYQEIGRAGRDGNDSSCYLFYSAKDFKIHELFIAKINNDMVRQNRMDLLKSMSMFISTENCRRKVLLNYFDEDFVQKKCNKCDNCCTTEKVKPVKTCVKQNVANEMLLVIKLIDSIKGQSFGYTKYINILRGSKSKTIDKVFADNPYFGRGLDKTKEWWSELMQKMVDDKYLSEYSVRSRIMMKVLKVSALGYELLMKADEKDNKNDSYAFEMNNVR